jgi:DNA-binding response OmpR family regulator
MQKGQQAALRNTVAHEEVSDLRDLGRVLTVMTDPAVGGLLADCLTAAGFKVRTTRNITEGLAEMARFAPDVIVADSMPREADLPPRRRYVVGPLELDVEGHYALVNGVEVHISPLEMRLLADLIQNRGRVRTRRDLLVNVWGYSEGVSTRTPDTHVNRLRTKLGAAGALVETVRGKGYRLSGEFPVVVKE